jgi:hypothetical protein
MAQTKTKHDWKSTSVKFEPDLDSQIEMSAVEDCRTKSDQIRFICRLYFEERERDNDRMGD